MQQQSKRCDAGTYIYMMPQPDAVHLLILHFPHATTHGCARAACRKRDARVTSGSVQLQACKVPLKAADNDYSPSIGYQSSRTPPFLPPSFPDTANSLSAPRAMPQGGAASLSTQPALARAPSGPVACSQVSCTSFMRSHLRPCPMPCRAGSAPTAPRPS